MKNDLTNIALEGTCSGDVVGGLLLWTGQSLRPKTPASIRDLKMLPPVVEALRDQRDEGSAFMENVYNPSVKEYDETPDNDEKFENFTPNLHQNEKRKLEQSPISRNHRVNKL